MSRFAARKAIVTGAAGGIGAAVVAQLVAEGATVFGIDRDEAGLMRQQAIFPDRFRWATANLQDIEITRAGIQSAVKALGGPADILVNAAGVYALAPAMQVKAEDWDFNQWINLRAPFFT